MNERRLPSLAGVTGECDEQTREQEHWSSLQLRLKQTHIGYQLHAYTVWLNMTNYESRRELLGYE